MAVVLLLVIVSVSYLCVRLGALALELTGVERERANFQALSAFTNSGFTTRESEEMVRHRLRRRIISFLMILGNAGMVTTIGTFAKSVVDGDVARTALNVGLILLGLAVLIAIARWQGLTRRLHDAMQRWLARHYDFGDTTTEGMMRLDKGYGVSRIRLHEGSPVAGRYLRDLDLKSRMIQILGIERDGKFFPIPVGDDKIEAGDQLIVYGTEGAIRRVFNTDATSPFKIVQPAETPAEGAEPRGKSGAGR